MKDGKLNQEYVLHVMGKQSEEEGVEFEQTELEEYVASCAKKSKT
jgi:hypothetical protein